MSWWLIGVLCFVGGLVIGAGLILLAVHSATKDLMKPLARRWR